MAARHASTVFVGRGAQFLLPADRGLAVFLVAPLEMRIDRIRELRNCSAADAREYIRETDKGRSDLVKNYFNHDIGDAHLYDLVINRAHIGIEEAAELIVDQCRRRFPRN
jgi:cytidylate kinase